MSTPDRPVWHLAEQLHWDAALQTGSYERSTVGATLAEVGFIHCAYPDQLPGVAKLHFARVTAPLVVLEIDPQRLVAAGIEIREESSFPHIYGALPVSAVTRTRAAVVERGWLDLGSWADTAYPQP